MKMTFRWRGEKDPVSLRYISQIPGMTGIVSAVYDVKPGEVWPMESIQKIYDEAKKHGLQFEVVESVPVPEEIKLGTEKADEYIEVYCENVRRLSKFGVKCICYNFMPVFDWLRSDLNHKNPDGSTCLAFDEATVLAMDPTKTALSLPGWDESYDTEELRGLIASYQKIGREGLWKNLEKFLTKVIPVCHECGIQMAIHPDDPPWDIFGLPRIITNKENLRRFLDIVPLPENGITLCTGSLGSNPDNDLIDMIHEFKGRIHFVHLRNILFTGERCFKEAGHLSEGGSLDMYEIVKALVDTGFTGYCRPDHGRMIWDETGSPGYGLYDRALGAAYLNGLFEAVEKEKRK